MEKIKYIILESLINEGRKEDTIRKYPNVPKKAIEFLSESDPSGNNKYLDWAVKMIKSTAEQLGTKIEDESDTFPFYEAGEVFNDKIREIIEAMKCFHEHFNRISTKNITNIFDPSDSKFSKIIKNPKDINSYDDISYIDLMCKFFESTVAKTASRIKIFEDDRWLVVTPLTHEASCSYGTHSNWCVSTSNRSYFDRYTKDGILVFFIDKKGKNPKKVEANVYKFALYVEFNKINDEDEWEWYSMEDARVDSMLMLNFVPSNIIEKVKNYLKQYVESLKVKIDTDFLSKHCLFSERDDYYVIIPFYKPSNMFSSIKFLDEIEPDYVNLHSFQYNNGMIYFILDNTGVKPEIRQKSVPWDLIFSQYEPNPNYTIKFSDISFTEIPDGVINRFIKSYNAFKEMVTDFTPENKILIKYVYSNLFNHYNKGMVEDNWFGAWELKPGDMIQYKYVNGKIENVEVIKVNPSSITLSNGKRISKDSARVKVTKPIKIVSDTGDVIGVQNESRWIRKRII